MICALGRCTLEDPDVSGLAVPVLVGLGILYLLAVAFYSLVFEPHFPSLASIGLISIDPDKWIAR